MVGLGLGLVEERRFNSWCSVDFVCFAVGLGHWILVLLSLGTRGDKVSTAVLAEATESFVEEVACNSDTVSFLLSAMVQEWNCLEVPAIMEEGFRDL